MKLIVGLGNPGKKYNNTRHNVGFVVVDALATSMGSKKWEVSKKYNSQLISHLSAQAGDSQLILAKPQTFMNDSGISVSSLASFFKIHNSDIYIVHDDLDIKLGEYKIQKGIGPKVHNGINSVEEKLGTKDFWRIRVGIDNRKVTQVGQIVHTERVSGEQYVLQNFEDEENMVLSQIIGRLLIDLKSLIAYER